MVHSCKSRFLLLFEVELIFYIYIYFWKGLQVMIIFIMGLKKTAVRII